MDCFLQLPNFICDCMAYKEGRGQEIGPLLLQFGRVCAYRVSEEWKPADIVVEWFKTGRTTLADTVQQHVADQLRMFESRENYVAAFGCMAALQALWGEPIQAMRYARSAVIRMSDDPDHVREETAIQAEILNQWVEAAFTHSITQGGESHGMDRNC